MATAMATLQVRVRHSRPYTPRTNGKVEQRVSAVSRMFFTELEPTGGLGNATLEIINKALESATAILNHRKISTSTYAPYEVTGGIL